MRERLLEKFLTPLKLKLEEFRNIQGNFNKPAPVFVSLLSTGLDSPIATYLMMKQGMDAITISFLNGSEKSLINRTKIKEVGKHLVKLTKRKILMISVDYDQFLTIFQNTSEPRLTCILCKRTMMDIAKTVAELSNAKFIVNGDILGEQASQTLDNLFVVHQINHSIPVIRPLIGFDKLDVIKLSQSLGLYQKTLLEGISCEFNPKYPETRAKLEKVVKIEQEIDRPQLKKSIITTMDFETILPV